MIRAIIIEDEENSRTILSNIVGHYFKNIEVMAVSKNIGEGKEAIEHFQPDLVFSDIELENNSVFDMLRQLSKVDFEIIFTTAFDKYALQAIKFSALDYLLKPFSKEDLTLAVDHYLQKKNKQQSSQQFDALFHNLQHIRGNSKKIVLPTFEGLTVVPVKEIIRCQSEVNYTNFFLTSKKNM